jgi:hypothetical protein
MDIEITFSNQKDALLLNRDIPPGVSLMMPDIVINKISGAPDVAAAVVISFSGIPATLLAKWIYDKIKHNRSRQICINRKEIHLSEGEITKVIEETIKIKE